MGLSPLFATSTQDIRQDRLVQNYSNAVDLSQHRTVRFYSTPRVSLCRFHFGMGRKNEEKKGEKVKGDTTVHCQLKGERMAEWS